MSGNPRTQQKTKRKKAQSLQQLFFTIIGESCRRFLLFYKFLPLGIILKSRHFFRCVFSGFDNRPKHRQKKYNAAHIKRPFHRIRNDTVGRSITDTEPICQHIRQHRSNYCPRTNEKTLHGKACRALLRRQIITYKRPERLHRHVDRSIHDPEHAGGYPKDGRIGHDEQSQGRQNSAHEKVRSPPAQAVPGAIAKITDDWLNQQARDRRSHPEDGNIFDGSAERFKNAGNIGVLQGKPKLNTQKAKAHVPDFPETELRLDHQRRASPRSDLFVHTLQI